LTIGLPKNKKAYLSLCAPGIISLIIIIAFLTKTEYIHGKTTYYSWGISAFACYISLVVHFTMILSLLIKKRRTLEKHKWLTTFSFILIMSLLLMVQVIWPETLITSLFPTVLIFGLYVNEEDPYFRRLQVYNETMVTDFATLVESRDNSTGGHINRTKMYVAIILHEMKKSTVYKNYMTKDYVKNVLNAAPLHDLGKISTPDHILQKPGKLEPEEFDIMKEHAKKGGEIILETFADLDDEDFQKIAYEVARFHHEKWDGKGYPEGLSGEDIPLHARIMAIADVFDAVSEKRCYRDAMPIDKCFQVIEEGKGTHFDPKLAELFLNAKESVLKIYRKQV
ncbi:MAG: HD domain-containing protein, partial [Clostridiales bacterium]|nr:HD domain-containing protein [Clostridiales bacterium]